MRDIPDPFIFREAHKRVGYARLSVCVRIRVCVHTHAHVYNNIMMSVANVTITN